MAEFTKWTILALERGHEDRIKIVSDVGKDGRFPFVCFIHGTENREANAHLIAASPEMYEALKYARRFLNPEDHDLDFIDKALKKAEGKL